MNGGLTADDTDVFKGMQNSSKEQYGSTLPLRHIKPIGIVAYLLLLLSLLLLLLNNILTKIYQIKVCHFFFV